jgi:hypothetical protein
MVHYKDSAAPKCVDDDKPLVIRVAARKPKVNCAFFRCVIITVIELR